MTWLCNWLPDSTIFSQLVIIFTFSCSTPSCFFKV